MKYERMKEVVKELDSLIAKNMELEKAYSLLGSAYTNNDKMIDVKLKGDFSENMVIKEVCMELSVEMILEKLIESIKYNKSRIEELESET